MPPSNALEIRKLTKTYKTHDVVSALTVDVATSSIAVLLGPNGAGKSTTLEIVSTLRTPTSGSVRVCGYDVVADPAAVRRRIGLTAQAHSLDQLMTPTEALRLQAFALGFTSRACAARTAELIELFRLEANATKRLSELSGGNRRRVDLALALIGAPELIILDEPTTGLDPLSRMDLWEELRRLNAQNGTTLLISTQDLHEAEELATDLIVLREGRLVAQGNPAELKRLIGSQTLSVTFTSADHAASALGRLTSTHTVDPARPEEVRIQLGTVDGQAVAWPAILTDLADIAPDIASLHLNEPSLDDVFAHLATADQPHHTPVTRETTA